MKILLIGLLVFGSISAFAQSASSKSLAHLILEQHIEDIAGDQIMKISDTATSLISEHLSKSEICYALGEIQGKVAILKSLNELGIEPSSEFHYRTLQFTSPVEYSLNIVKDCKKVQRNELIELENIVREKAKKF